MDNTIVIAMHAHLDLTVLDSGASRALKISLQILWWYLAIRRLHYYRVLLGNGKKTIL